MKRALCIILCLMMGITGCSTIRNTTDTLEKSSPTEPASSSSVLLKNYEANFIKWHDDDMLLYHSRDGLYAYLPLKGITKKLLSEELTEENWFANVWNSMYYGSSPDKLKYILLIEKRKILEIRETNTDNSMLSLNYPNDEIFEAGWFENSLWLYDFTFNKNN